MLCPPFNGKGVGKVQLFACRLKVAEGTGVPSIYVALRFNVTGAGILASIVVSTAGGTKPALE